MQFKKTLKFKRPFSYLLLSLTLTQPLLSANLPNKEELFIKNKTDHTISCVIDIKNNKQIAGERLHTDGTWNIPGGILNACYNRVTCMLYCGYSRTSSWDVSAEMTQDWMMHDYDIVPGEKYPELKLVPAN